MQGYPRRFIFLAFVFTCAAAILCLNSQVRMSITSRWPMEKFGYWAGLRGRGDPILIAVDSTLLLLNTTTTRPIVITESSTQQVEDKGPAWLQEAKEMSPLNETMVRCSVEYHGLFTLVTKAKPVKQNTTKEDCLQCCFKKNQRYAGYTVSRDCFCTSTMDNVVNNKTLNNAVSMDIATQQNSNRQTRIFRKSLGCFTELNNDLLEKAVIGCIHRPTNLNGSVGVWTMTNITDAQCILHCESHNFTAALPVKDYEACICSDFLSLFETPENMYANMTSCPGELEAQNETLYKVYRTFAENTHCEPKRFLPPNPRNVTVLYSFPGSGNTWIRHLLETATGVYTGSVYNDRNLGDRGMLGESLHVMSRRTLAVKDHLFKLKHPGYTSAIVLVRNIYNNRLAEFTRQNSQGHTGTVNPNLYKGEKFRKLVNSTASFWRTVQKYTFDTFNPVHQLYYEDLVTDPVGEVRKIIEFLPNQEVPKAGEELEERLTCMVLDLAGNFKRPKKKLGFDPFTADLRKGLDENIRKMDDLMKVYNRPPLPPSYYTNEHV